jgi:hypothetical protein
VTEYTKIILFQMLPAWILNIRRGLRTEANSNQRDLPCVDIDHFPSECLKSKRALVILSPSAWKKAKEQSPDIKIFNFVGLVFTLVSVLNRAGYIVDVVDCRAPSLPRLDYEIVVAHGGGVGALVEKIPKSTIVLQYVAGLYWESFQRETQERYERFKRTHGVKKSLNHRRSNSGQEANMDTLIKRSDACFTADLPRMIDGFGQFQGKFVRVGLGAYTSEELQVDLTLKDYQNGRRNFIYVGGTGGNIQKGLDVILEAFRECPEANLYIYCKVESEIMTCARGLLRQKNVHYIYHWRFRIFRSKLSDLMMRCNFTIHAPINTGVGTAFCGSLGNGLIPVGYIDLPVGYKPAILTNGWDPNSLAETIRVAMSKEPSWCAIAAIQSVENYQKYYSPATVERNFERLVAEVTKTSTEN